MKKRNKSAGGGPAIPTVPDGLTINVTAKFTIEELAAALKPNQIRAFLQGIGEVVKAGRKL